LTRCSEQPLKRFKLFKQFKPFNPSFILPRDRGGGDRFMFAPVSGEN